MRSNSNKLIAIVFSDEFKLLPSFKRLNGNKKKITRNLENKTQKNINRERESRKRLKKNLKKS